MCAQHQQDKGAVKESSLVAPSRPKLLARAGMNMVRGYQKYISPLTPASCRYHPTCSQYTLVSIARYGFFRGSFMGFKRIMRCHPFHPGGYDPVP